MSKIRTCLWFDQAGEEAARFYVSLIPNSEIESINRPNPNGPALIVEFSLDGVPYMALNGGPHYTQTPAASIVVSTDDQEETDHLWTSLTANGEESRCGWLVDRFGVSWQIVPRALPQLMSGDDPEAVKRVHESLMQMKKIDIATLQSAFDALA